MTDFRCNPYRDVYQDVFKAETSLYRVSLGFDDVTGEYPCIFVIKWPDQQGERRSVELTFSDVASAMKRIIRFMNLRPVVRPRVCVNY